MREDNGLSRAEIARQMNTSDTRLARLEKGDGVRDAIILSNFYELIIKHQELIESMKKNRNIVNKVDLKLTTGNANQQKTIKTRLDSRNLV